MGYESRLIVGEAFGSESRWPPPDEPCPMWLNPIAELSLSKMGQGNFSNLLRGAKLAGVFIYRSARMEERQAKALNIAVNVIRDQAPEGSFESDVEWMEALLELAEEEHISHREWEDPYGAPFRRLPFRETVEALRRDEAGGTYRRRLMAIDALEHFVRGFDAGIWHEYDPQVDGTTPIGKLMLIHEGY